MRKLLAVFCLFLSAVLLTVQTAQAANPAASNIFNSIGGTTTFDRGGSVHSQARSIYSLGGGMTSFQGKRVSLLSADAPSFSAGCNGISWHFGGFAFISLDEIRQLVEAVAQASLGIAVDLAMQTLCPQCYAVMAKLRDMANSMRNAAADACKIAQNFGALLKDKGVFSSTQRASDCSKTTAEAGKTSSFLDSWAGSACKNLVEAEKNLGEAADKAMDFLKLGKPATGKTPDRELLDLTGNVTFKALTALGYDNGVVKDVLLSLIGMTVVSPVPAEDCRPAFADLYGSAKTLNTSADVSAAEKQVLTAILATEGKEVVKAQSDTAEVKSTDAAPKTSVPGAGGTTKGPNTCYAPPLLSGFKDVAKALMCGFAEVDEEALTFANSYYDGSLDKLRLTSLGVMCSMSSNVDMQNPLVYTCRASEAECLEPKMVRLSTLLRAEAVNGYTGLAWMVGDALFSGVANVRENKPLSTKTIRVLNGSGWPLYRLINMAAVYPAMAYDLLNAYTSAIAYQYAMDTLDKVFAIGSQPSLDTRSGKGVNPESITAIRQSIMEMTREGNATQHQVLERLAEKRKIVEVIMQVNKTLQAEVIGQGLSGNSGLAVSIKRQTFVGPVKP